MRWEAASQSPYAFELASPKIRCDNQVHQGPNLNADSGFSGRNRQGFKQRIQRTPTGRGF